MGTIRSFCRISFITSLLWLIYKIKQEGFVIDEFLFPLIVCVVSIIVCTTHTEKEKEIISVLGYLPRKGDTASWKYAEEQIAKKNARKEADATSYYHSDYKKSDDDYAKRENIYKEHISKQNYYFNEMKRTCDSVIRDNDRMREELRKAKAESGNFFDDIADDWNKIQIRYKALSKAFHPDMNAGNQQMFQKLNAEYQKYKNKYKGA